MRAQRRARRPPTSAAPMPLAARQHYARTLLARGPSLASEPHPLAYRQTIPISALLALVRQKLPEQPQRRKLHADDGHEHAQHEQRAVADAVAFKPEHAQVGID